MVGYMTLPEAVMSLNHFDTVPDFAQNSFQGLLRIYGCRPDQPEQLWGGNLLRVWQAAIDARTRA